MSEKKPLTVKEASLCWRRYGQAEGTKHGIETCAKHLVDTVAETRALWAKANEGLPPEQKAQLQGVVDRVCQGFTKAAQDWRGSLLAADAELQGAKLLAEQVTAALEQPGAKGAHAAHRLVRRVRAVVRAATEG